MKEQRKLEIIMYVCLFLNTYMTKIHDLNLI